MGIAAISAAAAEAVGDGWNEVAIAERPTDEALLALAARLCNNSDPK
jgi:uroporphyrinogen-III synthase